MGRGTKRLKTTGQRDAGAGFTIENALRIKPKICYSVLC